MFSPAWPSFQKRNSRLAYGSISSPSRLGMVATTIWSEPLVSKSGEFLCQRRLGADIDDAGIVDDAAGKRREIGGEGS
ncbi:hypothetical protein ACVILI_000558 [Mesorhizobium sp. USDA 4775]